MANTYYIIKDKKVIKTYNNLQCARRFFTKVLRQEVECIDIDKDYSDIVYIKDSQGNTYKSIREIIKKYRQLYC